MILKKTYSAMLVVLFLGYSSYAIGDTTPTEEVASLAEAVTKLTATVEKLTADVATLNEKVAKLTEDSGKPAEEAVSKEVPKEENVATGDIEAGEARYKKSCVNCHGAAGKGAASYPKISGNDISYTTSKLETYRSGIEIGPNSSLMIMMVRSLTDDEIANLAAYLKDAAN